jgi:NADH-quinone oxidoreductase subunit N
MATIFTILMFSLAGIPPLAGFFAKYFVFVAAIEAKLYALAIIGILSSVVGAFYYLRVIKLMWFDEATGEFARVSGSLRLVFGVSGLLVLAYVFIGGPIGGAAELAAATLF